MSSGEVKFGGLTGRKLRIAVTITSVLGFSLFGYDQGLMSGLITGTQFNDEFPATKGTDRHATVVQGAVTACYEIGCFFGAIFALFRGDHYGRRPIVLFGAFLMIIGTIISITPFKGHWALGQFVVGRVISGLGNGLDTATIPVWQSEMSRPENRGILVSFEGSVIAVGTFIAYWIDFGFSYVQSTAQWRFPVAFQIVFAIALFIGMWLLPESPRWLIKHGRMDEAKPIMLALESDSTTKDSVETEARLIADATSRTGSLASGFKELFTGGPTQHFRRMLIGASAQFQQQFTGCNAAIYYSTVLFKTSLGQSDRMSLILGGVFATVYMLATIPSFFLIERAGRRTLFFVGAIGQGCSFIITFACLAAPPSTGNSKGAAVGLYLFIVFFAFTILQLPWIYPPEINPMKTRTAASAVSTCTNWISNAAVVLFTPVFIGQTRWGAYLFFAILNFLWVPLIYFYYPETAQRSLEEIDLIFAKAYMDKKPAFRVAQHMPKLSAAEVEAESDRIGLFSSNDGKHGALQIEKDQAAESQSQSGESSSGSGAEQADDVETQHAVKS